MVSKWTTLFASAVRDNTFREYKIRGMGFVHRFSCIILRIIQLIMEEQFHLLDLQIAKFTEFGVCMIFPGVAELDHLRNSSEKLAEQWPILRARINLLVSVRLRTIQHTIGKKRLRFLTPSLYLTQCQFAVRE
jgi:hypothetical protein